MTTAALTANLDLLNELFDNQKKLDDIFFDDESSLFDEQIVPKISMIVNDHAFGVGFQNSSQDSVESHSNEDLSFNFEDKFYDQKVQKTTSYVVPAMVLEIAVISYCIINFT